jgi:hypothetical protein
MNTLKRATALIFGLLLLWTVVSEYAVLTFPILLLWPAGLLSALAAIRYLARRESATFGEWQDYMIVGLLGTAPAVVLIHLLSGVSIGSALLYSIAPTIETGGGIGAIAYALRSGRRPAPVTEGRPSSGAQGDRDGSAA